MAKYKPGDIVIVNGRYPTLKGCLGIIYDIYSKTNYIDDPSAPYYTVELYGYQIIPEFVLDLCSNATDNGDGLNLL
jgi:hypothetical protein